jgi:hypothetical protein
LSPSRAASALLLAAALAAAARADGAARLTVTGTVAPEDEDLVVSVQVDNRGDAPALPLTVSGELLGGYDEVRTDAGVAAGSWTEVKLHFPQKDARPGVHLVPLRLDYQSPRGGASASQAAYLLLALGANPAPAVRVFVGETEIETRGRIAVELESADGRPHVAQLRLITPKGINPFGEAAPVAVPAQGRVRTAIEVLRGTAARQTRQGVLVAAVTTDGDEQTAAVAEGAVTIAADPAVMPRLRIPLTVVAVLLLLLVTVVEVRRRWPRPAPAGEPAADPGAGPAAG